MYRFVRGRSLAAIVGASVLGVAGALAASASAVDNGVVHACYSNSGGNGLHALLLKQTKTPRSIHCVFLHPVWRIRGRPRQCPRGGPFRSNLGAGITRLPGDCREGPRA